MYNDACTHIHERLAATVTDMTAEAIKAKRDLYKVIFGEEYPDNYATPL